MLERIKLLIDHLELTVSAFADAVGVQRSSISHLLKGRNKPSLDFVMKVAQTYPQVDLYWLLYGQGSFPHIPETEVAPTIAKNLASTGFEDKMAVSALKEVQPVRIAIFYSDGTFESYDLKKQ